MVVFLFSIFLNEKLKPDLKTRSSNLREPPVMDLEPQSEPKKHDSVVTARRT